MSTYDMPKMPQYMQYDMAAERDDIAAEREEILVENLGLVTAEEGAKATGLPKDEFEELYRPVKHKHIYGVYYDLAEEA